MAEDTTTGLEGSGQYARFTGRERIYSKFDTIDAFNVADMVSETSVTHKKNVGQMTYLWKYYKGQQPVLFRNKDVRPEICNRVVENHAQEIVSFKTGYQLSEPIQYICRTSDEAGEDTMSEQVTELNAMMYAEDSDSKNRDLFEWMCVTGIGHKFAESDKADIEHGAIDSYDVGGAPFNIHIPDPWDVYVVYSSKYHHRPIAGVWVSRDESSIETYTVYTERMVYEVKNGAIIRQYVNVIKNIPIIEYDLNNARMGVFEAALPILDAINNLESNRMDGIEQVVQALYLFKNCQIDEETFKSMLDLGAVSVSSTEGAQGDVSLITNNLDQSQTQVTKDDLYQALIDICGMPNRNQGGANDTGSAVLLRDGWTLAESHAKSYELQFKKAERDFLRVILRICEIEGQPISLRLRDVDLAFNRRNYDNILTKAQVFSTLIATGKIAPLDCYRVCGLFTDPSAAYLRGVGYVEEQERKAMELARQQQQQSQKDGYSDPAVDHDGDGVLGEDNHGRTK